jgi:hypothetical protein
MGQKIVFDESGTVSQLVNTTAAASLAQVKSKGKRRSVESRTMLRNKKVKLEKEFHEKQYGKAEEKQESASQEPESKAPEAEESIKNTKARDAALGYLEQFVKDRKNWKFQKVRQTWILRNLYYQHQIDNEYFKMALKYMANMGERAKQETIEEAKSLLMADQSTEEQGDQVSKDDASITDTIRKRAKKIIKLL